MRCADAERLSAAAKVHQQRLRDTRRQLSELLRQHEQDSRYRDRRELADEKVTAQADYRRALARANGPSDIQTAAASWLRRLSELNRRTRLADGRADQLARRVDDLQRKVPALELAADAARISAEAAQVACLDARRTLAACEEDTARRSPSTGTKPMRARVASAILGDTAPAPTKENTGSAARVLMRGDRQTLLGLARRLAEETGFDAGRLQLLLLELREKIRTRAMDEFAFTFPDDDLFWSQFTTEDASRVAASLASMGYRFDGVGAWVDGRAPQNRDFALALSYCGYDARSLHRPQTQTALNDLWRGTTLHTDEYLLTRAPELALDQMVTLLGPGAGRLAELWDIWGRLRPLLMRAS